MNSQTVLNDDGDSLRSRCPKCGGFTIAGYGLMGGGIGAYSLCENEKCDYLSKTQDGET